MTACCEAVPAALNANKIKPFRFKSKADQHHKPRCAAPPPSLTPALIGSKRRPRPGAAIPRTSAASPHRHLRSGGYGRPALAARPPVLPPVLPRTRSLRAASPPTQKLAARALQPGHRSPWRGSAVKSRSGVRGDRGAVPGYEEVPRQTPRLTFPLRLQP